MLYADDPTHPIPFLNALDVFAVKKTGGSTLVIVIATPLAGDERSQRRLLRKFDNCLGFIASEEFRREHGAPRPDSTEIKVAINANSDPIIFDLLESCRPWVADNHATLTVERQAK